MRRTDPEHPSRLAPLLAWRHRDPTERAYRMTVGELVLFALAIASWGTVIALVALFVRLRRLPALGQGASRRRALRDHRWALRGHRTAPRFGPIGETLPQRH